ncbi:MAG: hypothetical protein H6999_10115 [Hahellaceae bacterium]|nr:hypothetical protein [Hahellaceae bacterium]
MQRIFIFLTLLTFSGCIFAGNKEFSIDGKFYAFFPFEPQFSGEIGQGAAKHRSYSATDESNIIIYNGTYQVGYATYKQDQVKKAMENYVLGQATIVGGSVVKSELIKHYQADAVLFEIHYSMEGVSVVKYGIAVYKRGHFYQWAVQEFPKFSKKNGRSIFEQGLRAFRLQ